MDVQIDDDENKYNSDCIAKGACDGCDGSIIVHSGSSKAIGIDKCDLYDQHSNNMIQKGDVRGHELYEMKLDSEIELNHKIKVNVLQMINDDKWIGAKGLKMHLMETKRSNNTKEHLYVLNELIHIKNIGFRECTKNDIVYQKLSRVHDMWSDDRYNSEFRIVEMWGGDSSGNIYKMGWIPREAPDTNKGLCVFYNVDKQMINDIKVTKYPKHIRSFTERVKNIYKSLNNITSRGNKYIHKGYRVKGYSVK